MENLVILTKQNVDSYQLTEQTRNDILTYDADKNPICYSHESLWEYLETLKK